MWWPGHIELVPLPSCLQKPQHHLVPSALADHDHGLLLELCGSYHVTNSCRELGPAAVMVHELVLASSIAHSGHIAMDICVARQTITRFLLFVQLDAWTAKVEREVVRDLQHPQGLAGPCAVVLEDPVHGRLQVSQPSAQPMPAPLPLLHRPRERARREGRKKRRNEGGKGGRKEHNRRKSKKKFSRTPITHRPHRVLKTACGVVPDHSMYGQIQILAGLLSLAEASQYLHLHQFANLCRAPQPTADPAASNSNILQIQIL